MKVIFAQLFIVVGLLFSACANSQSAEGNYGIFKVVGTHVIEMNGSIEGSVLEDFNALVAANPAINRINMIEVPGADDDINSQLASRVFYKAMHIHIVDDGLVASGGVDFFLAGAVRTKGSNSKIGVHSWDGPNGVQATDFPVGHEQHLPYIDYYVSTSFTQEEAENFYYFTINAAPASSIHWMAEDELKQYRILTQ